MYEPAHPGALLWIDDEIRIEDALVRWLAEEGFQVECAANAEHARRLASLKPYDGVILDLKLPDGNGLDVLADLLAFDAGRQVLVLSGYLDTESTVKAMRLGAWDCKTKPILLGEEWVEIIRLLVRARWSGPRPLQRHRPGTDERAPRLLAVLCSISAPESASQPQLGVAGARKELSECALSQLVDPRSTSWEFLIAATTFRVLRASAGTPGSERAVLRSLAARLDSIGQEPFDDRVRLALARIAGAAPGSAALREQDLAKELAIDRGHLARLIHRCTGFSFRHWRWAIRVQPALLRLVTTHEQVAQIAYGCGYSDAAQLDRDFSRTLGISPTAFRRLAGVPARGSTII